MGYIAGTTRSVDCLDKLSWGAWAAGWVHGFKYDYTAPLAEQIKQSAVLCCDDPFWE